MLRHIQKCTMTEARRCLKNVLLLNSLHQSVDVVVDGKRLPETVSFYDNTKYGLVIGDQMASLFYQSGF